MHVDDLDGKAEDFVFVELRLRLLIPREDPSRPERASMDEWARWYWNAAHDVRCELIGGSEGVTVCERGHVMPESQVGRVPASPMTEDEPGYPEHQSCEDCNDEAVSAAEARAENRY